VYARTRSINTEGMLLRTKDNFIRKCANTRRLVGFEVITTVSTKMAVSWVVVQCSLVEVYRRFRGPCCLHHQGDDRPDDGGSKGL
jgi:hypothetical protein